MTTAIPLNCNQKIYGAEAPRADIWGRGSRKTNTHISKLISEDKQ